MATAFAWCINAILKIATESDIIRFFFLSGSYPGSIRVLSGSLGSTKNHIISDSVKIMATAFSWCINAVLKIAPESEIIRFFFSIRVHSGFYPGSIRVLSGSLGSTKNLINSDSVQIMATAFSWCISAVVKIAPESEIIRFFSYTGPIRVLSGSPRSTKNHVISDSVQIMATAFAWCVSAVVKIATQSEIIRFFFYPVLSGSPRSTKNHIISDSV